MIRSFIVILLLAVFFLTGMVYGIERDDLAGKDETIEEIEEKEQMVEETEQIETVDQAVSQEALEMEGKVHFTQKAASLLETVVKGFYEMVVQMLYQISQLFF
ncbi:hypothetical protein [Virgibacillus ainsalahensis]